MWSYIKTTLNILKLKKELVSINIAPVHNIIQYITMFCMIENIMHNISPFKLNAENIPHNILNPVKHC